MVNKLSCRASARTDKSNPKIAILKNNQHNHGLEMYGKGGTPYRPWSYGAKMRPLKKKKKVSARKSHAPDLNMIIHKKSSNTRIPETTFSIQEIFEPIVDVYIKEEPATDNDQC